VKTILKLYCRKEQGHCKGERKGRLFRKMIHSILMRIDRWNRLANPNNTCRFALPVLPKERSNPTVHTLLTITHHIIGLLAEQLTVAFAAAPK